MSKKSNEIHDKESLLDLNEEVKKKIEVAWKCIIDQYLSHAKKNSKEQGAGLSIYHFLRSPKKGLFNCEYYYAGTENTGWGIALQSSPDGEKIKKLYNPSTMFVICIQVPLGEYGQQTAGSIRIFKYKDNSEVDVGNILTQEVKKVDQLDSTRKRDTSQHHESDASSDSDGSDFNIGLFG